MKSLTIIKSCAIFVNLLVIKICRNWLVIYYLVSNKIRLTGVVYKKTKTKTGGSVVYQVTFFSLFFRHRKYCEL